MSTTERNIAADDGSRRTVFIVVAVISVLLIVGLLLWMRSAGNAPTGGQQARLEGGLRAGTPEFEQYRAKISMDKPEATEAKRALGDTVMTLKTTLRNFTGRTINGLEMYAAVVDSQGKPVKERVVLVIPRNRAELNNNETMDVPVMLEGFADTDDRANIKMEITAVRFK